MEDMNGAREKNVWLHFYFDLLHGHSLCPPTHRPKYKIHVSGPIYNLYTLAQSYSGNSFHFNDRQGPVQSYVNTVFISWTWQKERHHTHKHFQCFTKASVCGCSPCRLILRKGGGMRNQRLSKMQGQGAIITSAQRFRHADRWKSSTLVAIISSQQY